MIHVDATQLLVHGIGDFCLQSDHMATQKTKSLSVTGYHVFCYTLPFLLLTQSWAALLFIAGTHFVIDHWRLARYVVWAKEWLSAPWVKPKPWAECSATGYDPEKPAFLAVWLMILVDQLMHVALNAVALQWL